MENYISEIIMASLTFIVGYYETKRSKEQKKIDSETREFRAIQEARAEVRRKEAALSMHMGFTTLKLAEATACAVSGGKCNGNVTDARSEADKAMQEYQDFICQVAAKQTTKI